MADYDVGVIGLSSPPSSAVVTSYRPAVSVRNNGIHDAIASGYLRIYAAGLLVFETEVYSGTLSPGSTGTADAIDYWTPPAEGTYIIQGYVSTPLDQVEHNNNLAPVTVIVSGEEPPEPPTVPLHASQHEEGGSDPINVDGLPGVLKDHQLPSAHAAQHQAGGDDAINIGGLAGVAGDAQTPIVHGNAHHNPDMATSAELTAHAGSAAAHTAAANLANRETTGPLTGRVPQAQIQLGTAAQEDPSDDPDAMALRVDRDMGYVNPAHHAYKHGPTGHDPTSIGLCLGENILVPPLAADLATITVPEAWLTDHLVIIMQVFGHLILNPGGTLDLHLMAGAVSWCSLAIPGQGVSEHDFVITAHVACAPADKYSGAIEYRDYLDIAPSSRNYIAVKNAAVSRPASDKVFTVNATMTGGPADSLIARFSFSRSLGSALIPL